MLFKTLNSTTGRKKEEKEREGERGRQDGGVGGLKRKQTGEEDRERV